ncbi:MAG: hypothetical protein JWP01_3951 [Myxococcales bacterium]|nr:hypothetical protein [Myxococcales bacterium]
MIWAIRSETDLNRLVKVGTTTESAQLDFKGSLDRGPGAQAELGRDVAQFTNTDGGCLLIGVEERKDPTTNIKTAIRVVGVKDADKDREDIEAWIRNVLTPADLDRKIEFIRTQGVVVLAVNVPASRRLIWVNDPGQPNKLEVVRRTNHGKEYMRPNEIERHWSNTPRAAQIAFEEAFKTVNEINPTQTALPVEIVGGILRVNTRASTSLQKIIKRPTLGLRDETGFELRVPLGDSVPTIRVPFELLATAWADNAMINILCRAPIVYDAENELLRFDPFGYLAR